MLTLLVFFGWFCFDYIVMSLIYAVIGEEPWVILILADVAFIHAIYMSYRFHKKQKAKNGNQYTTETEEKTCDTVGEINEKSENLEKQETRTVGMEMVSYFSMDDVDKISKSSMTKGEKGIAFEEYCMRLLDRNGYTDIQATRATGDMGADIIARKYKRKIAFQCKCYDEHNVGVNAVQEISASLNTYGAGQGAVITNSYFTRQAKILAEDCQVKLIDRNELQDLIDNANEVIKQELLYERDIKKRRIEKLDK